MKRLATLLALACAATSAPAQDDTAFVEANLLAIFYHELGHALIDLLELPVYGQEEDAADVASIFLIDALFEPDAALDLAYMTALGFEAETLLADGDAPAYWDVHGPDPQRFYNTVCLFYGADPEGRADFAELLDLPEDRAATCPEEFDQAAASWGAVLDDIAGAGDSLTTAIDPEASLTEALMALEVAELNALFVLPEQLVVAVDSCGEANAFYDPETVEIIICSEFEDHLFGLFDLLKER